MREEKPEKEAKQCGERIDADRTQSCKESMWCLPFVVTSEGNKKKQNGDFERG